MKKRILAFLLLAMMLMSFVACGTAGTANEPEPEPEEDYSMLAEYVFKLQQQKDPASVLYIYDLETPIGDAIKSHFAKIEEKLGITIEITSHADQDVLQTELAAGSCSAEAINSIGNNRLYTFASAGLLESYDKFSDVIDYHNSTKYGYPNQLECAMVNSQAYAICPTLWPETVAVNNGIIVFNGDILSNLEIGDPRQYLEDKTWTWDNFLDLITSATYQDGEDTVYGFCTDVQCMAHLALASNGIQTIVKEGDTLVTDLTSAKCVEAIEFVQSLYGEYKASVCGKKDGSKWNIDNFLNGDAVLELSYGSYVINGELQYESKINFGLLPFPCGPSGVYGQWAHELEAINGFSIPVTADMPENAAFVLNKLFDAPEGYEQSIVDYYKASTFINPTDAETYVAVATKGRYTYWTVKGNTFHSAVGSNLTKNPASIIETYVPQMEEAIEQYIMPNYDYIANYLLK